MFSSFRELMDKWDTHRKLILENDLCLFFKKDGKLYGTTETGRITFARMKNPESDDDKAWRKDATFTAYDLEKTAEGDEKASVFGLADIVDIKMVDEDEAKKILKKKHKELPSVSEDDDERTYGEE